MDQIWALLWHTLHEKSIVAVVLISITNGCRGHCKINKFITSWILINNKYKWKKLSLYINIHSRVRYANSNDFKKKRYQDRYYTM